MCVAIIKLGDYQVNRSIQLNKISLIKIVNFRSSVKTSQRSNTAKQWNRPIPISSQAVFEDDEASAYISFHDIPPPIPPRENPNTDSKANENEYLTMEDVKNVEKTGKPKDGAKFNCCNSDECHCYLEL